MAFLADIELPTGETRNLYVRLNNWEQLANHGVPAIARFRGYLSKKAFEDRKAFVTEWLVEFPADAPEKPWEMAYEKLKERPEFAKAKKA